MKKLSQADIQRIDHYRKKTILKQLRRRGLAPTAKRSEFLAPPRLNLDYNYEETIDFFQTWKKLLNKNLERRRQGYSNDISMKADFRRIREISVPAGVILAAELDRMGRKLGHRFSARNIKRWNPKVASILNQLGVFKLLHVQFPKKKGNENTDQIVLVELTSDDTASGEKIGRLLDTAQQIISEFSSSPYLYEGISEAIQNAVEHAYPQDIDYEYEHCPNRWWATVCFDKSTSDLRFFVYDQGIGIPESLPRQNWMEHLSPIFQRLGLGKDDAGMLRAALEYGRTSTHLAHRGKGLPKMVSVIDKAETGSLRIVSGRAEARYQFGCDPTTDQRKSHVGGTLVEWRIPLEVLGSKGA